MKGKGFSGWSCNTETIKSSPFKINNDPNKDIADKLDEQFYVQMAL